MPRSSSARLASRPTARTCAERLKRPGRAAAAQSWDSRTALPPHRPDEAFAHIGGVIREREPGRFEISQVPAELRRRDRQIGSGAPMLRQYERVTFEKDLIAAERRPLAEYVTPGHPLLDGTIDLIIERHDSLLRRGTVLIDENDPGLVPHVLVYLQHSVVDGRADQAGNRRVVSRRFEFVSVDPEGTARAAGWAPYLDLRPATSGEIALLAHVIDGGWVRADLENAAMGHGVGRARAHLEEVRRRTVDRVERTTAAVKARLESEIRYWDHHASQLKERELAGKLPPQRNELGPGPPVPAVRDAITR